MTTQMEFDAKAKSCGQIDRTPQKIYSRHSSFRPYEGPDQRRMLIVCGNFKGKKILSCKRNVYPWETNMFSDQPVCVFVFLSNVKQHDC